MAPGCFTGRFLLLSVLVLVGGFPLAAQHDPAPGLRALVTGPPASFTSGTLSGGPSDSGVAVTVPSSKSPALAMLLSAVLPGVGGQIYTEQYWHIPVYGGLFYWFGRNYRKGDDLYTKYRDLYAESVALGVDGGQGDRLYRRLRDFYVNERERFAMYILLTYVANIVDAYVSASLFSFDVGESLNGGQEVRLQLRLPLGDLAGR